MTRINTIDPFDLLDQHLFAEWRELPRIFALARYWSDSGERSKIPDSYRLGTGHVRFFYDKLQWLAFRHAILTSELLARGYNLGNGYIELGEYIGWMKAEYPQLWNGWEPNAEAHRINLERLQDKLDMRPDFYTQKKRRACPKHYEGRWMWWYRVTDKSRELLQQHAKDINP